MRGQCDDCSSCALGCQWQKQAGTCSACGHRRVCGGRWCVSMGGREADSLTCRWLQASPGADVGSGEPSPGADVAGLQRVQSSGGASGRHSVASRRPFRMNLLPTPAMPYTTPTRAMRTCMGPLNLLAAVRAVYSPRTTRYSRDNHGVLTADCKGTHRVLTRFSPRTARVLTGYSRGTHRPLHRYCTVLA